MRWRLVRGRPRGIGSSRVMAMARSACGRPRRASSVVQGPGPVISSQPERFAGVSDIPATASLSLSRADGMIRSGHIETASSRSTMPRPGPKWRGDQQRIRWAALASDGRMLDRRDRTDALGRYALRRHRGRDRPDAVDQPPRGGPGGFRATGRNAVPVQFLLGGSGDARRQHESLQRTHRRRAAPVPRRCTDARAAEGQAKDESRLVVLRGSVQR